MKIRILTVGKTKSPHLRLLFNDYIKRLTGMVWVQAVELDDIKNTQNMPVEVRKKKEGEQLLKHIKPSDYVILLDEK
jgi:23S rRNA (pseudouridine1915-N3)-methyltransferase